jgi:hypothetical protein
MSVCRPGSHDDAVTDFPDGDIWYPNWLAGDKTVVDKAEADGADKAVRQAKRISHAGVTGLKSGCIQASGS